jgi:nicotinamide-nucleotide amidase
MPLLAGRLPGGVIVHKNIMTYGLAEAMLAEKLVTFENELPAEIRLAYLPAYGVIKLRLTTAGRDERKIKANVKEQVEKLYNIIPDVIYGEDEVTLEEVVGKLLNNNNLTLATAESCTGGKIASLITSVPGSSGWFKGSVVAYDNSIKTGVLGVSNDTLRLYGAVSAETAGEMARGARRLMGADYSVAVTGIAGPAGGTTDKPVGTVWIAIDSERGLVTEKQIFADNRLINISRSSYGALNLLRKQIVSR